MHGDLCGPMNYWDDDSFPCGEDSFGLFSVLFESEGYCFGWNLEGGGGFRKKILTRLSKRKVLKGGSDDDIRTFLQMAREITWWISF